MEKLASFIQTATQADRSNVIGTFGDVRKDWDTVELGKSTVHAGMLYVVLGKGDQRLSVSFSKALSTAFNAGEIKASMLNDCEVAIQANAAGEERLKLQFPAGGRRVDISGVKQESFKRTFTLADILAAGKVKDLVS